jgi:hypothetical protein
VQYSLEGSSWGERESPFCSCWTQSILDVWVRTCSLGETRGMNIPFSSYSLSIGCIILFVNSTDFSSEALLTLIIMISSWSPVNWYKDMCAHL